MSILSKKINHGFTLVETLVAVSIATMVLVAIIAVFVTTIDISRRINYEYTAMNIAKSRIERARNVMETSGFDSLPDLAETDSIVDSGGSSDQGGDFKRTTTVATTYDGDARLTQVTATVIYKYRDEWKNNAVTTLTTVFANIIK